MNSTIRNISAIGIVGVAAVAGIALFTDGGSEASPPSGDAETSILQGVLDLPELSPEAARASASAAPEASAAPDLPSRGHAPDLVNIDGWLQSDISSLEELEGQVVAVQFWTLGCNNWQATLPAVQELYENYKNQGFEIVGIHSPEFDYEAELENVVDALERHDVAWPIALDPTKRTFHSWQEGTTGYWPRIYLIDRAGNIRYDHHGEGRYDEIDAAVQALLAEPA